MQDQDTTPEQLVQPGLYIIESWWSGPEVYRSIQIVRITEERESQEYLADTLRRLVGWTTDLRARRIAD